MQYALGNVQLKEGVHEWKCRLDNFADRGYILFGVISNIPSNPSSPYQDPGSWGFSTQNTLWLGGSSGPSTSYTAPYLNQGDIIHLKFDITAGTFTINCPQRSFTHLIPNIPTQGRSWYPHFVLHESMCQITLLHE
eukprot:TRINITY_DN22879_c0_g2_i2.p1 TRINITY_DN22879_c0_g2~~TRINITY_DN22879_c0_g2_i2.p1  ORF type:complete len:136 (-),score=12.49 TRINITY_DN22879_c0_g2_i2:1-408(-)